MSKRELNRAIRHARKANRLGPDAKCTECGEHDIRVLRKVGKIILCDECENEIQGRPRLERHHLAGRRNDHFNIPVPANVHVILSDAQNDWPRETLINPDQDILRVIAAWFRGIYDLLIYLAEKLLNWATRLEALSKFLASIIGSNWSSKVEGWEHEDEE